ncbi:hypothetical protein MTO96_001484 [Rhipicephalus appendiculatus]
MTSGARWRDGRRCFLFKLGQVLARAARASIQRNATPGDQVVREVADARSARVTAQNGVECVCETEEGSNHAKYVKRDWDVPAERLELPRGRVVEKGEGMAVKLYETFTLVLVYISPNPTQSEVEWFLGDKLTLLYGEGPVVVIGDINVNIAKD